MFWYYKASFQSLLLGGWSSPAVTPYWLSLSRSTNQVSPSVNGSDTLILSFDTIDGTTPWDYAANIWTVPTTGEYLINYNDDFSAATPANADFVATYLNHNWVGTAADAMYRFGYFNSQARVFITDTRIWSLTSWDTISFEALLSSHAATTFTMSGSSWRFAHVSIQKIA